MKVMPTSRWRVFSSNCISLRSFRSSAPRGSSSSSTSGRLTSARARAMRCCWPPESCLGRRLSMLGRRTICSASSTRRVMSGLAVCFISRPKATFSPMVRCGKSAYCWNTVFTGRWKAGVCPMGLPWMKISPSVGSSNPAIMRRLVVLPQPEGPSSEKNSPSRICSVTFLTAATISPEGPGKRLETLRSSTAYSVMWAS